MAAQASTESSAGAGSAPSSEHRKRSNTPRPRKRSLAPQVEARVEQIEQAEAKRQAIAQSSEGAASVEVESSSNTPEEKKDMEPGSDEVSRETETEESRERSRSPSRPQSSGEHLVQKKTDEIKYEEIPLHLLQEFHEAMAAEATSINTKAKSDKADRLLKSRWHLKLKDKETPEKIVQVPKARWILVGFKDPDLEELLHDAYSPTPSLVVINLALMALASSKTEAYVGDLSQAFLQAQSTKREIYIIPPEEGVPGVPEGRVLRLLKEVYGPVGGPSSWRRTAVEEVRSLGYRQSVLDACTFLLPPEKLEVPRTGIDPSNMEMDKGDLMPKMRTEEVNEALRQQQQIKAHDGIIVILVDDLLEGGTDRHRQKITELQKRFKFGKHVSLMKQPGGAMFNGRRLQQRKDYSFQCSMQDYTRDKMDSITIPKGMTDLNQAQREMMRTVTMKLLWCARQARPDVLGTAVALSSCKGEDFTLEHFKEASKTVQHLKQTSEVYLWLQSLQPEQTRLAVFTDGSPGAKSDLRGSG
eukprot:6472601-Amphidinium_carterae.1